MIRHAVEPPKEFRNTAAGQWSAGVPPAKPAVIASRSADPCLLFANLFLSQNSQNCVGATGRSPAFSTDEMKNNGTYKELNQLRMLSLRHDCCNVRGSSGDLPVAPTFRALSPEKEFRERNY